MIGDSLRTNPGNLFSTLAEAKKKLVTGSYAGIYVSFWICLFFFYFRITNNLAYFVFSIELYVTV